jgi:hypothetical protein
MCLNCLYNVDVMASLVLQVKHHVGKLPVGNRCTEAVVADLKILAKEAKEIAVGKKDRPGTVFPDQRPLLAEVGSEIGNHSPFSGLTYTRIPGETVNSALSWTQGATGQNLSGRIDATSDLS